MQEPRISPYFTMDDIRKIRDRDYERTKNMTSEELCAYYNTAAERVLKEIAERKAEKQKQKTAV